MLRRPTASGWGVFSSSTFLSSSLAPPLLDRDRVFGFLEISASLGSFDINKTFFSMKRDVS